MQRPLSTHSRIERAFRHLNIRPEAAAQVPGLADVLARLEGRVSGIVPSRFRSISGKRAKTELATISRLAARLDNQISRLHEPSVVALADEGILTFQASNHARLIAERAASAGAKIALNPPHDRGRPRKLAAEAIATIVSAGYSSLTGKTPTISTNWSTGRAGGPFLHLLAEVFAALKVRASPEAAARKLIRNLKRREPKT